jgi:hypothetical protein
MDVIKDKAARSPLHVEIDFHIKEIENELRKAFGEIDREGKLLLDDPNKTQFEINEQTISRAKFTLLLVDTFCGDRSIFVAPFASRYQLIENQHGLAREILDRKQSYVASVPGSTIPKVPKLLAKLLAK